MFSCLRHGVKTYIRKLKGILMRRVWVFIFFYGFRECVSIATLGSITTHIKCREWEDVNLGRSQIFYVPIPIFEGLC